MRKSKKIKVSEFYEILFSSYSYNGKIFKKNIEKKIAKLVFLPNLWPKAIILGKGTF